MDHNSKFHSKVRRELVKKQIAPSHAAADRLIRIAGLDEAARKAGVQREQPVTVG